MKNVARATVIGAAATVVGWVASAGVAVAQTTTPSTGSPTSTTPTTAPGTSLVSQHDAIPALLWAFAFGVVTIGGLLLFLYFDRRRSLAALSKIAVSGLTVTPASEPSLASGQGFVSLEEGIQGPTSLSVGSSAAYKIVPSPAGATFAWTVSGPGKLDSTNQATTQLTASDVGTITLHVTVTVKGSPTESTLAVKAAAATTPAAMTDKVPFLGNGYGTVVVLLAVASVTAALGLTNVLNGQAVAGVLASIVTYSVVRATGAGSGGGSASGSASGGSQGNASSHE